MTKTDGAVLKATGLSKSYRLGELTIPALRDVDLTVRQGEFLAVMGPSGSGKSTLLQLLGLLDVPDSGEVEIAGERTATLDDDALTGIRRSKLGFLFQSFELIPNLSARENVLLPAEIAGRGAAATGRLAELADALGIADRLDHRPRQLSGGQRQRVALARALINEPLVVLADEPSGNLDAGTSHKLHDLLFDLRERTGVSLVVVTHNPDLAKRADRILVLEQGQLRPQTGA